MANLPESESYDAGVYQLETTDAVVGGASGKSNASAINLANRTKYLKAHIDIMETIVEQADAEAGIATALKGWTAQRVRQAIMAATGGMLTKSVAGNSDVTLTAVEAGNGLLKLTGVLTGNINVIVPTSPTRSWLVNNQTTGAYTLTVKTASGTGVIVAQTGETTVYTDGVNVCYNSGIVPQAEAETRTATTLRGWTAQRVGQAIAAAITALVVQATESVLGIAKIATQAQTNDGTNDATIVSPLKLKSGFAISKTTKGYIKLPDFLSGLIIQWGSTSGTLTGGEHEDVSYSMVFPNAVFIAVLGPSMMSDTTTPVAYTWQNLSTSQIRMRNASTMVAAGWYIAVGH